MQPMHWYGLLIGVVTLAAQLSGDRVIRQVSWLCLLDWALSNAFVQWLGFTHAPVVVPAMSAMIALAIGMIGYRNRSPLCFGIVLLYLAHETVAVVGFTTQRQSELWYYTAQNSIFLLRMAALGGWSIGALMVDRGLRGRVGVVPSRASGRQGSKP